MRGITLAALAIALLLSACSRQSTVLFEVDLLTLAPADDRSTTLSLVTAVSITDLYLPCSDPTAPCGGFLVDLRASGLLQQVSFTLGLDVDADADLDTFDLSVYVAPADASDAFVGAYLWGTLDGTAAAPLLELSSADARVAELIGAGTFRVGVKIDIASSAAAPGDDLTIALTAAELKLGLTLGGLLP